MQASEHSANNSSARSLHGIRLRFNVLGAVNISIGMGRRVQGEIRHWGYQSYISSTWFLLGDANLHTD
jgi:hypothetical protein